MARILKPQTSIQTPGRQNIGAAPQIEGAVKNLTGQIQNITGQSLQAQRTREAQLAAQNIEFQRDEQGRLIAPELPELGKFIPKVFDQQYTLMVTNRYKQQVELDYKKSVADFAVKYRLDPAGFEMATDAYRESLLETVMPQVAAEIQLGLDTQIVQTWNYLNNEHEKREWDRARKSSLATLEQKRREIGGEILAGADTARIEFLKGEWQAELALAHGQTFVDEFDVDQMTTLFNQDVAMQQIITVLHGRPNTEVANMEGIAEFKELIETGGEFETPNGPIKIADVWPTLAERTQALGEVAKFLSFQEGTRAALENAKWDAKTNEFMMHRFGAYMAMVRGEKAFTPSILEDLDNVKQLAMSTKNLGLLQIVDQLLLSNQTLTQRLADREIEDATEELFSREVADILQENPEALRYVQGWFNKWMNGALVQEWIEQPIDSTGLNVTRESRMQLVRRLLARFNAENSGGKLTDLQADIMQQMGLNQDRWESLQTQWIQNNGSPQDAHAEREMFNWIRNQIPGLDIPQTKEAAAFLSDVMSQTQLGVSTAEYWSNPDNVAEQINAIDSVYREWGAFDRDLGNYLTGIFNKVPGGGISDEQLTHGLTLLRALWDVPAIRTKLGNEHGVGGEIARAADFIFNNLSADRISANNLTRKIITNALAHEESLLPFDPPEDFKADLIKTFDEIFDDEFTGFFDKQKQEDIGAGVVGNPGGIEGTLFFDPDYDQQYKDRVLNAAMIRAVDVNPKLLGSDRVYKNIIRQGMADVHKKYGYVIDDLAWTGFSRTPGMFAYAGQFLIESEKDITGAPAVATLGLGNVLQANYNRPPTILSDRGPRAIYTEPQIEQVVKPKVAQTLKELFPDENLVLGKNVFLYNNTAATAQNRNTGGGEVWTVWRHLSNSTGSALQDPAGGDLMINFDREIERLAKQEQDLRIPQQEVNKAQEEIDKIMHRVQQRMTSQSLGAPLPIATGARFDINDLITEQERIDLRKATAHLREQQEKLSEAQRKAKENLLR